MGGPVKGIMFCVSLITGHIICVCFKKGFKIIIMIHHKRMSGVISAGSL